jgi:hypothetical protein
MAQFKVVDLVVQHGRVQIVRHGDPPAEVASRVPGGMAASLARISTPWTGLVASGVAFVFLGAIALAWSPFSLIGLVMTNLFFSAGACLAVLGLAKRWSAATRPALAPATPRIDPHVLAERCRRVKAILRRVEGPYTFERLVRESKWTQAAMLSTLLHMKEQGEIIEDLDLDTGQWVYTLADAAEAPSAATSPMLEERQAFESKAEGHG